RLVPSVIRAAQCARPPVLNGDGTAERDFLYVEDAAHGFLAIASALREGRLMDEIINLASGVAISIHAVTQMILRLCGRDGLEPVITGQAIARRSHRCSSAAKAEDLLGWRPLHSIEEGISKTLVGVRLPAPCAHA